MKRYLGFSATLAALIVLWAAGYAPAQWPTQTQWPRPSETRPVTQGGDWTISHIGSTVHVTGTLQVGAIDSIQHISSVTHVTGLVRTHYSGALRAFQIQSCGTTVATVVTTNEGRRDLLVKNIGLPNNPPNAHTVFIGFGATGHVALTVSNGWPLHAAGVLFNQRPEVGPTSITPITYSDVELRLDNYQGPLSCISTGSGSNLSIIEVLR